MFHRIEREFSDGEPWSFGQYRQLPTHLQFLTEKEQGRQDIWELPSPIIFTEKAHRKNNKGGFIFKKVSS